MSLALRVISQFRRFFVCMLLFIQDSCVNITLCLYVFCVLVHNDLYTRADSNELVVCVAGVVFSRLVSFIY